MCAKMNQNLCCFLLCLFDFLKAVCIVVQALWALQRGKVSAYRDRGEVLGHSLKITDPTFIFLLVHGNLLFPVGCDNSDYPSFGFPASFARITSGSRFVRKFQNQTFV